MVERLAHYLSRGKQYGNPLAYYDENLDSLDYLRDEINRQIRNEAASEDSQCCQKRAGDASF